MNKVKLIINYLISQALPLEYRKSWKRNGFPPKITIATLFLIVFYIYYPIKKFLMNIKFFLWVTNQNIDKILKKYDYENIKLLKISYK
jgi:hypothetical protein